MYHSKILVRTLFVFILLAGLVAGISLSSLASVRAAPQGQDVYGLTMAQWTFDPTPTSTTNPAPSSSSVTASSLESGVGSIGFQPTGAHTGNAWAGTTWSTTATPSAYFEFDVSSVGYTGINISFWDSRSGQGPTTVSVKYSTDGSVFTPFNTYVVGTTVAQTSIDLSSIAGLNNNMNAKFRIYGISAGNPGGSLRIDDVTFTGCQLSDAELTGTSSGLAATASIVNITNTANANLTATEAANLTATALSANLTATAASAQTATAAASITPTITPSATSTPAYSPLSLVINEVAWAGTKCSPYDEWVELYNPGSSSINLSAGWYLKGYYYGSLNNNIQLQGTILSHAYFLLADNKDVFKDNPNPDQYTNLNLVNNYQSLQLISPSGNLVDTANYAGNYNWPAGSASPNYASMERYDPPGGKIPYDGPSAWVTFAGTPSTTLDDCGNPIHGTPGKVNWASTVTETPSPLPTKTSKPTFTPAPTPVPAVVLNEILARPGSDWNGDGEVNNYDEFIEVENLGPGIADLTDWQLEVVPNDGSGSFTLPSLQLNPNERAVFFGSTTDLLLEDSGDTVSLVDSDNITEDAFTYPAVLQPDDSWCRIRDGIGYWRDGCFPTPGFENALSGILPAPPPPQPGEGSACLLPDVAPDEFRLAECNGSGADIWNQQYWNDLSGQNEYAVPDPNSKGQTYIQ